MYILLGKPDEMKAEQVGDDARAAPARDLDLSRPPGADLRGRQAKITLRGNCELPQGDRFGEALNQIAGHKIVNTNFGYKQGPDGKLVKLDDQKPKPSPAQTLLMTPRQDFPLVGRAEDVHAPAERQHVRGVHHPAPRRTP